MKKDPVCKMPVGEADLPFGGTKRSGFGRELSELGIQEFINRKLIRVSKLSDPLKI